MTQKKDVIGEVLLLTQSEGRYVMPAVSKLAVTRALADRSTNITLVNAHGACLVLPLRVVDQVFFTDSTKESERLWMRQE